MCVHVKCVCVCGMCGIACEVYESNACVLCGMCKTVCVIVRGVHVKCVMVCGMRVIACGLCKIECVCCCICMCVWSAWNCM